MEFKISINLRRFTLLNNTLKIRLVFSVIKTCNSSHNDSKVCGTADIKMAVARDPLTPSDGNELRLKKCWNKNYRKSVDKIFVFLNKKLQ